MIKTHSECTIQISFHNTVQLFHQFGQNHWLFVHELNGCWFDFCFSDLNYRYNTCFQKTFLEIQEVAKYRFTLNAYMTWLKHTINAPFRQGLTTKLIHLTDLTNCWVFTDKEVVGSNPVQSLKSQIMRLFQERSFRKLHIRSSLNANVT